MGKLLMIFIVVTVALRKESVDRNSFNPQQWHLTKRSLSARRAWIEILYQLYDTYAKVVALRKESVDRNLLVPVLVPLCSGRSPQGERG